MNTTGADGECRVLHVVHCHLLEKGVEQAVPSCAPTRTHLCACVRRTDGPACVGKLVHLVTRSLSHPEA
jgi:hypothetical protein